MTNPLQSAIAITSPVLTVEDTVTQQRLVALPLTILILSQHDQQKLYQENSNVIVQNEPFLPKTAEIEFFKRALVKVCGCGEFRSSTQFDFFVKILFSKSCVLAIQPTGSRKS